MYKELCILVGAKTIRAVGAETCQSKRLEVVEWIKSAPAPLQSEYISSTSPKIKPSLAPPANLLLILPPSSSNTELTPETHYSLSSRTAVSWRYLIESGRLLDQQNQLKTNSRQARINQVQAYCHHVSGVNYSAFILRSASYIAVLDWDWPAQALEETNYVTTTLIHLRKSYLPTHWGIEDDFSPNAMDTPLTPSMLRRSFHYSQDASLEGFNMFTVHGGIGNGGQVNGGDGDVGEGDDFYDDGDGDGGGSDE
ncbi:hypothetical protein EV360DRAFT_72501 [Lentinula raphanica]|nr:hypothetical protein EV360DRAFT_72501 [Lentinula raphanica]